MLFFVTDGNPNAWYTRPANDGGPSGNSRYDVPTVWEGGNFKQSAYDAAIPNAVNLSTLVGNRFYGIYCGNTSDAGFTYLDNLMSASNGGSPSYTTAQLLTQIRSANSVTYNVLTNTHLSTTYKYGENTYSDPPVGGLNSEAMLLENQTITVQKDWHNELDAREASNTTLTITKDGVNYIDVVMGTPTKLNAHEWRQSPTTELHISCGFMTIGCSLCKRDFMRIGYKF